MGSPEQKKKVTQRKSSKSAKKLTGASLAVSPGSHQNPTEVSGNLSVDFNKIWSKPPVREM